MAAQSTKQATNSLRRCLAPQIGLEPIPFWLTANLLGCAWAGFLDLAPGALGRALADGCRYRPWPAGGVLGPRPPLSVRMLGDDRRRLGRDHKRCNRQRPPPRPGHESPGEPRKLAIQPQAGLVDRLRNRLGPGGRCGSRRGQQVAQAQVAGEGTASAGAAAAALDDRGRKQKVHGQSPWA